MTAGQGAQVEEELNDLRFHWGEAYKITYHPAEAEPWHAERLDDGSVLTVGSPWALRNKIIDDYGSRRVPRLDATSRPGIRPGAGSLAATGKRQRQP